MSSPLLCLTRENLDDTIKNHFAVHSYNILRIHAVLCLNDQPNLIITNDTILSIQKSWVNANPHLLSTRHQRSLLMRQKGLTRINQSECCPSTRPPLLPAYLPWVLTTFTTEPRIPARMSCQRTTTTILLNCGANNKGCNLKRTSKRWGWGRESIYEALLEKWGCQATKCKRWTQSLSSPPESQPSFSQYHPCLASTLGMKARDNIIIEQLAMQLAWGSPFDHKEN
jgi:hypothetical protein